MSVLLVPSRAAADLRVARIVAGATAAQPTYAHVGSTIDPDLWPDRHPFVRSRVVGRGPAGFSAAVDGLRSWCCHRGIRARVHPADAPIIVDTTIAVELPIGPVRIIVPNRVVTVTSEPDRFGFAYGTLPGHEERGEEGFVVEQAGDGTVTATVSVDAVPATPAARLAGPAVVILQRIAVRRYLNAWATHVTRVVSAGGGGPA